jgi:hypothetical protein
MIRRYSDALARVGTSELCSYAGGRSRYLGWQAGPSGAVTASVLGHVVARFTPGWVELATADHPTPTTFDAIATALDVARSAVGTRSRVPYILGHRMHEGMRLDYAGRTLDPLDFDALSPLAEHRYWDLDVVDVSGDQDAYRVTVRDWSYSGRDLTNVMRELARAYVAGGRATVVNRYGYPTPSEPHVTFAVAKIGA